MIPIPSKIRSALAHPLARGSAIVFIGSMLSNVSAYLYHLIVGRILGPEKYGELASLFSLSYMLNVPALVVQTFIAKQIATYNAKHAEGQAKRLIVDATRVLGLVSLGVGILTIPLYGVVATFLHVHSPLYVAYIVIASIIFFLATIITGALQGYKKFADVMIFGNISIFLRLIGGVIGALSGVGATALANLITTICAYALSLIPLRFLKNITPIKTELSLGVVGKYAIPSLLCILGITSLYSTDVILVKHYFSAFDAGMYAALAMMGKVIFFAGSSVAYVLLPAVAERKAVGNHSHSLIYLSVGIVAAISLVLTGGYFLFPQLALQLLFGASYIAAAQYLGIFGIFITFYSLANVVTIALLGLERTGIWLYLMLASVAQIGGITMFHRSIGDVIYVNAAVCATLFVTLLLYYRHERL